MTELNITSYQEYRRYLKTHPEEKQLLDSFLAITISRFFRDRRLYSLIAERLFPTLILTRPDRDDRQIRIWSCGCCGGEEPYSIAIIWHELIRSGTGGQIDPEILATDLLPANLERARRGIYPAGSLRDIPDYLRRRAFQASNDHYIIKTGYRRYVRLVQQDIRKETPAGMFDMILCRNLAITYFKEDLARRILSRLISMLNIPGFLIIGSHEHLPALIPGLSHVWGGMIFVRHS